MCYKYRVLVKIYPCFERGTKYCLWIREHWVDLEMLNTTIVVFHQRNISCYCRIIFGKYQQTLKSASFIPPVKFCFSGKVKLFLCLIKHYATRKWEIGGLAPQFLTSTLVGGEKLAALPDRFIPWKSPPFPIGLDTGWTPKTVWISWRREILAPAENRTPTVHSITHRYTHWVMPNTSTPDAYVIFRTTSTIQLFDQTK
jgi:hypothetical protein